MKLAGCDLLLLLLFGPHSHSAFPSLPRGMERGPEGDGRRIGERVLSGGLGSAGWTDRKREALVPKSLSSSSLSRRKPKGGRGSIHDFLFLLEELGIHHL